MRCKYGAKYAESAQIQTGIGKFDQYAPVCHSGRLCGCLVWNERFIVPCLPWVHKMSQNGGVPNFTNNTATKTSKNYNTGCNYTEEMPEMPCFMV